MLIFYNTQTAKIHHAMWGNKLPEWYELSSDENFIVLSEGLDPHIAIHCKLDLNGDGKPVALHKPVYGESKGEGILAEREVTGYEKLELVESVEVAQNLYEIVTQASEAL